MSDAPVIDEPTFAATQETLRDERVVTLRSAEPDDALAVLNYMRTSAQDSSPYILTCPDERDLDEAQERIILQRFKDKPGALMMLVEDARGVVGLLGCESRSNRSRIAHIGELGMTVAKAYWGSGLGTAMMSRLIAWAESSPVLGMLQLQVYADNERAIRLYKGHGFVEAGTIPRRTRFADGSTRDDVIMYRRVDGTLSDSPQPGAFWEDLGGGVALRQVRYGDAQVLYAILLRNKDRLSEWFRWDPGIRSVADVRYQIALWIEQGAKIGGKTFVIEVSGEIVGVLFFSDYSQKDKQIELGYWLDGGCEGKGLMTLGCRTLLRHCFDRLGMNRVDITAGVGNTRSRAVADRLGMTQEGVFKQWQLFPDGRYVDVARYALLRQQWEEDKQ